MWIEILVGVLIFIIVAGAGAATYLYIYKMQKESSLEIRSIVDEVNRVNQYGYEQDMTQENNIKNLEANINKVNKNVTLALDALKSIQASALTRADIRQSVASDVVKTSELNVNAFGLTNTMPKSDKTKGNQSSNDWLYLYKNNKVDGGLSMNKLNVGGSAEMRDVNVNGALNAKRGVTVTDDLVFNGSNKWILHTPDDGRSTMYVAPSVGSSGTWNWNKAFTYENNGYFSAYGGGINVRGGTSAYNPDGLKTQFPSPSDNKNYIRGDTELRGDMNLFGTIKMSRNNPGPMVEKNYGRDSNRYGMGQFTNGKMRVYTAGEYAPATVSLSLARANGLFDDVVTVNTDKNVDVNGKLCLGSVCLMEREGDIHLCDRNGNNCKKVTTT